MNACRQKEGFKYSYLTQDAVCCSVLQCVAVCCSVLQCVAVCCSVLQCVAVCCSVLQLVAVTQENVAHLFVSASKCVAMCCSVLQRVAACCSVLQCVTSSSRSSMHQSPCIYVSQRVSRLNKSFFQGRFDECWYAYISVWSRPL